MVQQNLSRSQRRMERKQAVVLLGVALGIALVSFSLGVMVGRGGSNDAPLPQPVAQVPAPVAPTPPPVVAEPPAVQEAAPAATAPGNATDEVAPAGDKLTFYDTLPRGDQPLGSGINLPPREEPATPAPAQAPATSAAPATPATKTVPATKPMTASVAAPAKAVSGGYVLQVASFRDVESAETLRQKLASKGYPQFTEPADLGSKGTWYRVYVGPVATKEAAEAHSRKLQEQEKITPLLRKR